jgi:glucose/arabinose dehydrogenase
VTFLKGDLYIAEPTKILRLRDIETHTGLPPQPIIIYEKLPTQKGHHWRYMRAGPDGKLYVGIGAPCNACEPGDPFASIARLNADGTNFELYATGIRNSVGFDWHPQTKELWFTDNGRDWLGDDQPGDELNSAPRAGMFFGFPYCHNEDIVDPEFGTENACKEQTAPAHILGPHVASLGMRFIPQSWPLPYAGGVFIAEHGSWNRQDPIGYRITFVPFERGQPNGYEVFAEGWLQGSESWGRPVDIEFLPDGTLLVSDDKAGAIYAIRHP